jgi:LmbE family N-acetylglucosaminyl deacetylase
MRLAHIVVTTLTLATAVMSARPAEAQDGKLRIIAFGAHPDDAEIKAGGVAALWAAAGHHVKFVSVTNGDIGHHVTAGAPLALRRTAEVKEAARILGIEATEVLDIHDGELLPTLENRRTIARLIREWRADVVIGPRPNDYHPDHRYAGVLINDASYMVTVPFFVPDVPPLKKNPLFLYYSDDSKKPNPFQADIVAAIDGVIEKKLVALVALTSQFVEGGANGHAGLIPKNAAEKSKREAEVSGRFRGANARAAERFREQLVAGYGERGRQVKYAEAFEICEYGRQPSEAERRALLPPLR